MGTGRARRGRTCREEREERQGPSAWFGGAARGKGRIEEWKEEGGSDGNGHGLGRGGACLVLLVGGVAEDAAVEEGAVDVADHGADVARRVLDARLALGRLQRRHVLLQRLVPVPPVRLVHRVDLAALGDLDLPPARAAAARGSAPAQKRARAALGARAGFGASDSSAGRVSLSARGYVRWVRVQRER